MAKFTGGDILEITYNHPRIGGGVIFTKANEDATILKGGRRSEDDDNLVTSDGQMIDQMAQARWKYTSGPIAWDITGSDEHDRLQELQSDPQLAEWTIEHIAGAIYRGIGKPVGEIEGSFQNATTTLTLAGGGKLEKI